MRQLISGLLVVCFLVASVVTTTAPAYAERDHYRERHHRSERPPRRRTLKPPPPRAYRWDRRGTPRHWGEREWRYRRRYLRRRGHDDDDHEAVVGLVVGVLLGFALGAAVVDTRERQSIARSRLNDPGWIAYCARKYHSFDPYTGTYLGYDGLRHYCR